MRRPLPDAAFESHHFWRERLAAASLREGLAELGQVVRWVNPDLAQQVQTLVVQHPAQKDPELAESWVEGCYLALGHQARATLLEHAASRAGSAASRSLAAARVTELDFEAGTREALKTQSASEGPMPASLRLPKAHLRAGEAREWILGWQSYEHHGQLLAQGVAPALVADCDGTLWRGDIGELIYLRAVKERWFLPVAAEPVAALLSRYGLPPTGDPNRDAETLGRAFEDGDLVRRGRDRGLTAPMVTREFYAAGAWGFAGHSVARIKGWAAELFEEAGFAKQVFAGARAVLTAAAERGVLSYACSASNQWIVEVGVQYLGIPPWRARGIEVELADGVLGLTVREPVTYGHGKVLAAREMTGGRPLIGMGDSVDATDRELLESALIRWGVCLSESRRAFVQERVHDNWGELDLRAL